LASGQTVEIFTSKSDGAGPSRDWLTFVRSPRAASKIKQWFSRERREDAIATGQDELQKAMRREGLPVQKIAAGGVLATVADKLNYTDLASLHAAVGEHHVSAKSIAARVAKELETTSGRTEETLPVTARSRRRKSSGSAGVHVEGLDDVLVRLSRCCTPVPGDEIIGFVTRGRGVSVHRDDCANAMSLSANQNDRLIDVEWDADGPSGKFIAAAEIKAYDRSHLLSDVSQVFSENHVNILSSTTQTGDDRIARLSFEFEIADPSHLEELLRAVRKIDGVYDAYRMLPGRGH
jgi:GTP pyrophosphokinase